MQANPEPAMLESASNVTPRRGGLSPASIAAGLSITLLLWVACSASRAEVRIEGDLATVQVEARDSSVAEVLDALAARFGLSYPPSGGLDRPVSRTLEGPIRTVLSRLLEDY